MAERTTKKQVENAFKYLCDVMGKDIAKKYNEVGKWRLDHNSVYGGWVIEEIHNEGGAINHPFGYRRRKASDFVDFCHALIDGAAMATGKQPYELIRQHKMNRIAPLWADLTYEEVISLQWIADRYTSGERLLEMYYGLNALDEYIDLKESAQDLYKAWSAGEDDGADKGTIPCLGGRLQEKWQATLNIYKPWDS